MKNFQNVVNVFSRVRADASRDWLLLLAACILFVTASLLWNMTFFAHIVEEPDTQTVPTSSLLGTYDAGAISARAQMRREAARQYEEVYTFVDPSR